MGAKCLAKKKHKEGFNVEQTILWTMYIRLKTSDLKSHYPCVCLFYNDLLMWNVYTMPN